ncbi:hypothetical protein IQ268_18670 [Oculatella sp. LEGE 06141]|uniref:hypothetical protein n=1 Tax=Oculatella sp. LEGE 06141 TaxID=1828648 RepID=UPI00187F1DB4|nr:hypothetical protein [Oculatella sp. LEGE 06141]MBE9180589.1 hypothetical protein [Oculatella sp. LEGE 06141]
MADVNGTWLGTYWQAGSPTRFEATLVQSGNTLTGRILDDGNLGEAQITGEVSGLTISFTKRYLTTSLSLVSYTGAIAVDADFMSGKWSIGQSDSGEWEAHRGGENLVAELNERLADEEPAAIPLDKEAAPATAV